MARRTPLPDSLGTRFHVGSAPASGVSKSRLRGNDLETPFRGIRTRIDARAVLPETPTDPYARLRSGRIRAAHTYAPRLLAGHFYSHETAAALWGAPLPLRGTLDEDAGVEVQVCVVGNAPFPRTARVVGHRVLSHMASIREREGLPVSSPACTWAMLGHLEIFDLVAIGDYFCRAWRTGYGRPAVGTPSLSSVDELRAALNAGRRA